MACGHDGRSLQKGFAGEDFCIECARQEQEPIVEDDDTDLEWPES